MNWKEKYDDMNAGTPQLSTQLKGEGYSKKLLFSSSPTARKCSAFPLSEASATEKPTILKKLISKAAQNSTSTVLGSQIVFMERHSARFETGERRKNLQLT